MSSEEQKMMPAERKCVFLGFIKCISGVNIDLFIKAKVGSGLIKLLVLDLGFSEPLRHVRTCCLCCQSSVVKTSDDNLWVQ